MKKTLSTKWENSKDTEKVTIESTGKKLYGTAIWIDKSTGKYYAVERYTRLGRTMERAQIYELTKEEFEAL